MIYLVVLENVKYMIFNWFYMEPSFVKRDIRIDANDEPLFHIDDDVCLSINFTEISRPSASIDIELSLLAVQTTL